MQNRSRRRLVGGLVLAVALIGVTGPTASAETDLGDLLVVPGTGTANDFVTLRTPEACPVGAANIKVSINGAGISDQVSNNLVGVTPLSGTTPNGDGFEVTSTVTLKDIFTNYAIVDPNGPYTINLRCQSTNGGTIYGDFLATIAMTDTANAFEGTYAYVPPTPDGVATTTALAPTPASPIAGGTQTTLTATITPSGATGSVQFKDGAANLGAPVAVVSGAATSPALTLGAGSHSLTAVFTSSDTNAFLSSTSAATTYVVAGAPTVSGTAQVGRTLTCTTSAGGTQAYRWLVNGAATGTTSKSVVTPGAWYDKSVACRATFTHNGSSVERTSAARKIALGARLVVKVRPKVLGVNRVGRVLTCSPGSWSPAASTYRYAWFRGAVPIRGKVAKTYRTVRADKGRMVTCRVTAIKTGYASGVVKAPARKIL